MVDFEDRYCMMRESWCMTEHAVCVKKFEF